VAEDDRVGDLHHRGLEVHAENSTSCPWRGRPARAGRRRARGAHDGGVDDLALETFEAVLEHGGRAVGGDELDAQAVACRHDDRLLVGAEVVDAHGGDVGLAVGDHAPIEWGCLRA
jgi:hypothetical protein